MIIDPHTTCGNNILKDRVSAVANWTQIAENIMTSYSNEEEIVARWIIDNDYTNKLQRRNLLNSDFSIIGIGLSNTPNIRNVVVAYFADGFNCTV